MINTVAYLNLKEQILEKIKQKGGWVNCHAHLDRAYTLTEENFHLANKQRSEKWLLNDELKERSTVDQIYDRMAKAIERLLEQGVTATGTFIDVDYKVKDKSIKAAQKIREVYGKQIIIKYLNQSSYGLFNEEKESRKWFELGAEFVDIIGGLLKADSDRAEEHLDVLLGTAKRLNKMVHCHADELNTSEERETELLARKTIEHGMQGKVVGIHGISIAAHPLAQREKIYDSIKVSGMMYIACPVSWLNSRREERVAPTHNPVTPIDEMIPRSIIVGLGIDNLADIWMPFNDADMWMDLRVLFEGARYYDIEAIVDIATVNGRKVLGIE